MIPFRCIPIATASADSFRASGSDDAGNTLIRREPGPDSRCPCRHCLEYGKSGQSMLLGSFNLPRPRGVYWTPSPIFVHAERCGRYERVNHIPEIIQEALISLRAYDAEDLCIYELGCAGDGLAISEPLQRALADCEPRSSTSTRQNLAACSVEWNGAKLPEAIILEQG